MTTINVTTNTINLTTLTLLLILLIMYGIIMFKIPKEFKPETNEDCNTQFLININKYL